MKSQKPAPEPIEVPSIDINAPLKIDESQETEGKKEEDRARNIFYMGIAFFCLILILVTAIFVLSPTIAKQQATNIEKSTDSITLPLPTAGAESIIQKDWTLEVLNGSEVHGKAKTVANKLQEIGFRILRTGNYSGNQVGNTVFISSEYADKKDLFLKELKLNSIEANYSGILEDSSASARIILGK